MIVGILLLVLLAALVVLWAVYMTAAETNGTDVTLVIFVDKTPNTQYQTNISQLRQWLAYHSAIDNVREIRIYNVNHGAPHPPNDWFETVLTKPLTNHAGVFVTTVESPSEGREDCRNRSHSTWVLELNSDEYLIIQSPLGELLDGIPKSSKCLLPVYTSQIKPILLQRMKYYNRPDEVQKDDISPHKGIGIEDARAATSPQNLSFIMQHCAKTKERHNVEILSKFLDLPCLVVCHVEDLCSTQCLQDIKSCCGLYDKVYLYTTSPNTDMIAQDFQGIDNIFIIQVTDVYNMQQVYVFHILQCVDKSESEPDENGNPSPPPPEPSLCDRNMFVRAHEAREVTEKYHKSPDHPEAFWCLKTLPECFCVRREILESYKPDFFKELRDMSKDKRISWPSIFAT